MLRDIIKYTNDKEEIKGEASVKERRRVFEAVSDYLDSTNKNKINYKKVPVSGKVIGKEEILNAVDACLDGWFTEGRFNKAFEKKMAAFLGIKYFLTCNSGSSANLLAISALCSDQLGEKKLNKGD